MTIELLRLHRLELPLVRPFRTSFGTIRVRDVILVEAVTSDGPSGWGECVCDPRPAYSYEYNDMAIDVIEEHLLPRLAGVVGPGGADGDPEDVRAAMEPVRGHHMAKGGLSTAILDAWLRERDQSLAAYLGSVRDTVACGVSVGIPVTESIDDLLAEVGGYVEAGYRRVKLKIQPGWDVEPVRAVREAWPDLPLQTDANQAYRRSDAEHLAQLDVFDLLLHEQPLEEDDWYGHVLLSQACRTPICLDESIHSAASADSALALGACSIINIKPGRVGGYLTARDIHDIARAKRRAVWCGGMLETGIGRAANLALASLPGFTLPGDTSASDRYYGLDVTPPFVLDDGFLPVPQGPGIGVDPIPAVLEELTVWSAELRVV